MAATNRDLAQARAAQQAARVAAQADMARLEAQEFHRIVEENRHSEQQQLEKVCTCAPECIIYTYTYVSGIIIIRYAGLGMPHVGSEPCWECMFVSYGTLVGCDLDHISTRCCWYAVYQNKNLHSLRKLLRAGLTFGEGTCLMNRWMDAWMDGRTDGQTDVRTDVWMDGWMNK